MRKSLVIGGLVTILAVFGAVAYPGEDPPSAPDVNALIEKLGADSFAVRRGAEKEILDLGKQAIPALEEASKNHEDAHIRFEAERLLHRITGERPLLERPREEIDERVRRMNRGFTDLLDQLAGAGLLDPAELERLREMLSTPGVHPMERFLRYTPGAGATVRGVIDTGEERVEYEQHEDGSVVVKVTRDGETKTVEASSLEDLEEKDPELFAKVRRHFGPSRISIFRGPVKDFTFPPRWFDQPFRGGPLTPREVPLREPGIGPPSGFRLGIWVGEITDALRSHLSLAEDEGLLVEEVVPGSLADRIGLARHDVVRRLNGTSVGTPKDVMELLSKLGEGGRISLEVVRKGEPLTLVGSR